MLHINSELIIHAPKGPDYDALPPVKQHVTALTNYALRLAGDDQLSPEAASFAHLFAQRHDSGYQADISVVNTDQARKLLGGVLEAVESDVDPRNVTDYLQKHESDYMASRIIGHGVLSLIENTRYFQEEHDLSLKKSLGLACILSAHHPGFPITMVSGFLQGDAVIPDETRSAFFIDDGGTNPEAVRRRMVEYGASQLGVSVPDALRAAVLGYALDRLSAGSVPDELHFNDGSVTLSGGEVLQKKYGLVAGDLVRHHDTDEPLVHELLFTAYNRIIEENNAATAAAKAAGLPDIEELVALERRVIEDKALRAQRGATAAMVRYGLEGRFSNLEVETKVLRLRATLHPDNPNIVYALAAYEAILKAIQ